MKPIILGSVTGLLVVLSFAAFGQKDKGVNNPASSAGRQHGSGLISTTAMPADPNFLAAQRAMFAEAHGHEKEAKSLYASIDLTAAERECQQALEATPVIGGQKQKLPSAQRLLGRIYLREGRNQEALAAFQSCYHNIADAGQNLDIAIAYARLGDYAQAKKFYSDWAITQYRISEEPLKSEDLPGTGDLKSLEASALFARGLDEFFQHQQDEALDDFKAAEPLAPNNVPIAYWCAQTLMEKGRIAEAAPRLELVVASDRGHIFHQAKQSLYAAQAASKAAASAAR